MYEFRYAKKHVIARTFHKGFGLIAKYLMFGLIVALGLKAQQSSPSAPTWSGVVRAVSGEPVGGAKVTVYTAAAKEKITAVTGSDGRFAITDIQLGPHKVSVQVPGRGPTAPVAVDIAGIAVVLTVCGPGRMSAIANLPSLPVTAVIFFLAAAVCTVTFAPATGSPAVVRTTPAHVGADGELCCAPSETATISPSSKNLSTSRNAL